MSRTPLHRALLRALSQARRDNLDLAGLPAPVRGAVRGWSRRRFLAAGMAVPALAWAGGLPRPAPPPGPSPGAEQGHRVAVVGGGLAGLNAAWRLMQAGIDVALYEASPRLGGRVLTLVGALGDGLVTELGGEFINSDHADMIALARQLGLKVYNRVECPATRSYPSSAYYFGGSRHTERELAVLLRSLAGQIAADATLLDREPGTLEGFDRLSAAEYLDRHANLIPEPFVRALLEATIRSEYGVEPGQSSAVQLLLNLPTVGGQAVDVLGASDEAYAIQGGNSRIVAGLADALGDRVHTGRRLVGLKAPPGGPVELRFQDGPAVAVDQAILAFPFKILREVEIEAELPPSLRRAIAELDPGRNEKVLAGFARRVWHQDGGFAVEAWTDLGFAEVWDATLDPSGDQTRRTEGVLTFFAGGDEVQASGQTGNPQARGRQMVERLDRQVPGLRDAATGRYIASAWSTSPFFRGAYTNHRPGQMAAFATVGWIESDDPRERQEVRAGALVFAGEHLSDDYFGYMNGAAQTGRLAADSVLRHVAAGRAG